MLNNIGKTVGDMGEAFDPIYEVMEKQNVPDYDPSNPESIKAYQKYLIAKGEHGVASQLNHVYESSLKKRATDRIGALKTNEQKRTNIQNGMTANSANPQATAALTEALRLAEAERDSLMGQIDSDPYAQELQADMKKEEVAAKRQQLALEREELAAKTAAVTEQEQKISNSVATAVLTGQVSLADYNPESPDAFFDAYPAMKQAATQHPEAFEDAITRARDVQTTAAEIRDAENAKRLYTKEDITGEDGLGLSETVANGYRSVEAQFGVERANEWLEKETIKELTGTVQMERDSVNTVYNTTTIPLYQRTVAADLNSLMMAGGTLDATNALTAFFGAEDEIVYSAETRKLRLLLEDDDTRKALASQVVVDMMNAKANATDPEVRAQYVREAVAGLTGVEGTAATEEPEEEVPAGGNRRRRTESVDLPTITTQAQFDALEVGAEFYNADGSKAVK
jgi:hypothetical protein